MLRLVVTCTAFTVIAHVCRADGVPSDSETLIRLTAPPAQAPKPRSAISSCLSSRK